ncbi:hypothetical protein [Tepidiforma sp.]|uniref:hypothetical protein n=1 Tax=Tepidiforma sp. TaxID=2682230 RepID=UPI002ADD6D62|nr:hypothetical protein [Tepidiforma sp.]
MVNPGLTILVDLVLIGTAAFLLAAMATEAIEARRPHVGRRQGGCVRPGKVPQRRTALRSTVGRRAA